MRTKTSGKHARLICDCSSSQYLKENLGALKVKLSPEELKEVRVAAENAGAGLAPRNPDAFKHTEFIDTPPLDQWSADRSQ